MQIIFDAVNKELHDIFWRRWNFRTFPFHDGNQLGDDFTLLVAREQVGDQTRGQNVIDIFQEGFLLDVLVSEEESGS